MSSTQLPTARTSEAVPHSQLAAIAVHIHDDDCIPDKIPRVNTCDECIQPTAARGAGAGLPTASEGRTHLHAESKLELHVSLDRLLHRRAVLAQDSEQAQQKHEQAHADHRPHHREYGERIRCKHQRQADRACAVDLARKDDKLHRPRRVHPRLWERGTVQILLRVGRSVRDDPLGV